MNVAIIGNIQFRGAMRIFPRQVCKVVSLIATGAFVLAAPAASAVTVSLACGSGGIELDLCKKAAKAWEAKTGNSVRVVSTPKDTTSRLALFQQVLSAGSSDIDVMQIDVIWPGIIGQHLLDLTPEFSAKETAAFFPATIANNKIKGRLVALPWYMDTGLLYYRRDLLEKYGFDVPRTWDEMARIAKHIQDAEHTATGERIWGFVFQGRASEGLTCNALEWLYSMGGVQLIDDAGRVTVNVPAASSSLMTVRGWIGTISPPGVLNYSEEEGRGVFQSGRAVFMRNWPYAWALVNSPESPVAHQVGIAPLPAGSAGLRAGVLGGQHLAVSKYSLHPRESIDLIRFLASAAEQKRRSIEGSFDPTRIALYDDPEVLAASSYLPIVRQAYENVLARPSSVAGLKYNQVSYEFWNAVHDSLTGDTDPQKALRSFEIKMERISRHGLW
jgi:trehalose/maltose transport system substrate-binding protein